MGHPPHRGDCRPPRARHGRSLRARRRLSWPAHAPRREGRCEGLGGGSRQQPQGRDAAAAARHGFLARRLSERIPTEVTEMERWRTARSAQRQMVDGCGRSCSISCQFPQPIKRLSMISPCPSMFVGTVSASWGRVGTSSLCPVVCAPIRHPTRVKFENAIISLVCFVSVSVCVRLQPELSPVRQSNLRRRTPRPARRPRTGI